VGRSAIAAPKTLDGDAVQIRSAQSFADWFSTSYSAEKTFLLNLDTNQLTSFGGTPIANASVLSKTTDHQGNVVYSSELFFPIDQVQNAGDLQDGEDGKPHNCLFTFELNKLRAGEVPL
jgi:hypothetical protein